MINEMEGYDHNQCNNCISEEGCKGISTSSVDADVCNDGTRSQVAECDTHRFRANNEFHVFGEIVTKCPCNSINMLEHDQIILFE
jgi:hypothetical protein